MAAGVFGSADQRHRLTGYGVQVTGTAAQLGGHLLAGAVLDQTPRQLCLHALGLGAARQQQRAFHLHQMRRHVDELAGNLHPVLLHFPDGSGVLLDQLHDVDIIEVHFIFAHQVQQQIQRALKIFYFKCQNFRQKLNTPKAAPQSLSGAASAATYR